MDNTSQLLLRNLDTIAPGRLLLVNPPADDLVVELARLEASSEIVLFSQDYCDHQWHRHFDSETISSLFAASLENDPGFDQVIVFLARERQRARMLLEMSSSCARNGARIWLVGHKQEGIKTSSRFLAQTGDAVNKLDAARHCMLFATTNNKPTKAFSLASWFESFQVNTEVMNLSVASLPGVFSHGELDSGSRLLLENLDPPKQGRVLDFGCGCGIIGAWLKLQRPELELLLADSSALALAATRATIARNAIEVGTEVVASNVYSEIEGRFDLIVSNPPFHKGVATHYSATEKFFAQSARRLTSRGQLVLVANHFLRYTPLLQKVFGRVETLAERSGFRVYRCRLR